MKLEGFTENGTTNLNNAILNVAQKLKMTRDEFWTSPELTNKALDDVPVSNRIDLLIRLANKLYKR